MTNSPSTARDDANAGSEPAQSPLVDAPRARRTPSYDEITRKIDVYMGSVPLKHRARMQRVLGGGHASLRDRVTAMCLACSGYEFAEITNCTVCLCPLHAARPYQKTPSGGVADGADAPNESLDLAFDAAP